MILEWMQLKLMELSSCGNESWAGLLLRIWTWFWQAWEKAGTVKQVLTVASTDLSRLALDCFPAKCCIKLSQTCQREDLVSCLSSLPNLAVQHTRSTAA